MTDHMDYNWKPVQREDGYWYIEKSDGTAILTAIGTPVSERKRVAMLASLAPDMAEKISDEIFTLIELGYLSEVPDGLKEIFDQLEYIMGPVELSIENDRE